MSSPVETDAHSAPRGATTASKPFPANEKAEKLRNVFDKNFRSITAPVKHDLVSVLLLSWEPKDSDMDVSAEVRISPCCLHNSLGRRTDGEKLDELALVFRDEYQFDVQKKLLKESVKVKHQLDGILADFMYRTDEVHNLGIVYYAGHGFRGEEFGQLNLTK
ncbi:hypothetical protein SLS58_009161 [Diplodia intermedia]|uniref:Uncharacterized protein n=1 Tax=Diplodia intermedia TaxID=856260 RepID=A0ABR3TE82_9PEZI